MSEPADAECRSDDGHCITCSDEGTPVRVLELAEGTARCVDDRGVIHAITVDLVGGIEPAERLLAHAGVALTRLEGVCGRSSEAGGRARSREAGGRAGSSGRRGDRAAEVTG